MEPKKRTSISSWRYKELKEITDREVRTLLSKASHITSEKRHALEIQSVAMNLNYNLIELPGPKVDEAEKESKGPELLKHVITSTRSTLVDTRELLYKIKQQIGS